MMSDMEERVDQEGRSSFDPYVRTFDVEDLLLDPLNARIEVEDDATQTRILNAVADEGPDHLIRLAGDIVAAGMLNPADLPMVVFEDAGPVVVEGNRRLAALRALSDPSRLDNPDLARRAAKLGGKPPVTAITCIVFDARESADRWINLRHTGENEGIGVKGWNVAAQARFTERSQGRIGIDTAFLKWVETAYPDNEALLEAVKAIRAKQLTTLKRLLFGAVRPLLGIDWHKHQLRVTADPEAMEAFLESWFSELVTGKVGGGDRLWSRFTESDMLAYVRGHGGHLNVAGPELDGADWSLPEERTPPGGRCRSDRGLRAALRQPGGCDAMTIYGRRFATPCSC